MFCPSCGAAGLPEDAKFCTQCGMLQSVTCSVCGRTNPPGSQFCAGCGDTLARATTAPLAVAAAGPAPSPERRQVTVVFCDLVGSTALASRLDPEDLSEVIATYRDSVAVIIRKYAGTVSRYIGDGVLILFGHPLAHEDDPERAVRAALEVAAAVRALRLQPGIDLQVRIGIATGLVIVGDLIGMKVAEARAVVGETPNLAARLQALAEPNAIIIGESTRRLLGGLFEYDDLGAIELKGFATPMRAWRVRSVSAAESRFEALHSTATLTPLIGRNDEVDLLLHRWHRAKAGEGQVVLLAGDPGIGKSRLAAAIRERLRNDPYTCLRCYCSPYHQDSALHPIIAQLERATGIAHDDAPETKLEKLQELLTPVSPRSGDLELLADLMSISLIGRLPSLNVSPQRKKEKTFEALLWQLEALAEQRQVLMVIEDVHWIDPSSRELLDLVVEHVRRLPILLLITFRPEFQAPWIGLPHVTFRLLDRLTRLEGASLVQQIVRKASLPQELVEEIVERADGVPLFVEELTKTLLESEARGGVGQALAVLSSGAALAVPATLQASLIARLDRLGSAGKEIAQTGAALGREFSYKLLRAVAPQTDADLCNALNRLVEAELMFQDGIPPEAAFMFKHALVQDAAYGTLLKSNRRRLHAAVVRVLEEQISTSAETQPEVLARHCAHAGMVEKALGYRARAGEKAVARFANREALSHCAQALELIAHLPAGSERDRMEVRLRFTEATAWQALKGYGSIEVEQAFARARRLCEILQDKASLFTALRGLWSCYIGRPDFSQADPLSEALVAIAEASRDENHLYFAYRSIGATHLFLGRCAEAIRAFERGLGGTALTVPRESKSLRQGDDMGIGCRGFGSLALAHAGYLDQAIEIANQTLSDAQALASPSNIAFAYACRSFIRQVRREPAAFEADIEAVSKLCSEFGLVFYIPFVTFGRAWATGMQGHIPEAVERARRAWPMLRKPAGRTNLRAKAILETVDLYRLAGLVDDGLLTVDEGFHMIAEDGTRWLDAELWRLKGELLLAGRHPGQAVAAFERALSIARIQMAKTFELRAAVSLAQLWSDQKRYAEAHDLLEPIYAWFIEGLESAELERAKALLFAISYSRGMEGG